MTDIREQAITAIAQAFGPCSDGCGTECSCREHYGVAYDAMNQIVRADERRAYAELHDKFEETIRADERDDIEESFKRGGGNEWQANLYSMAYQRGCADERERNVAQRLMLAGIEQSADDISRQALTDLCAKVEGLRDRGLGTVLRSDVLALFKEVPK